MPVRMLTKDIYAVGYIDWDRDLFEDLEPLPEGTSYNSYLIKGSEKTALIDTVDEGKHPDLLENLRLLKVDKLDYIVSQHAEQDHSGSLPDVLSAYPEAKVVTNKKCKDLLMLHLPVAEDKFFVIEDGETLSLGNKTLHFSLIPWVHWPEPMMTYVPEDKVLFTADFLGSHLTSTELFVTDEAEVIREAKLYYADILMPFRANIRNHLAKIDKLDVQYIAPSHGQVYDKPGIILNAYKEWVSDEVKNLVIIPYTTTHGNVQKMVDRLVNALSDRGVTAKPYHVTRTDVGALSIDLVDAATVVLGSSTYIMGPHPQMAFIAFLVNTIRPKTKFWSALGSYAWATKVMDVFQSMITTIKPELIEPVFSQGAPGEEDFAKIDRLADEIAAKHRSIGILK